MPAGLQGDLAGAPYVGGRLQLTGFQNHLQVGVAAGLAYGGNLVEHQVVLAFEEFAPRNHHIDLVGPFFHGIFYFGHLDVEGRLPGRESPRHGSHLDARAFQGFARRANQRRIHTNRRHIGQAIAQAIERTGLLAHGTHFFAGIGPFKGGQVDHAQDAGIGRTQLVVGEVLVQGGVYLAGNVFVAKLGCLAEIGHG